MVSQEQQKTGRRVHADNSSEAYEEISEKKTSKLGYILLILMVIFIVGVGETIFSDLKKVPKQPMYPSDCISDIVQNLENLSYLGCSDTDYFRFNEIDKKFSLDAKYNGIEPQLREIISLNKTINSDKNEISNAERNIQKLNRDYDLGLQEKIAGEAAIMDRDKIKGEIEVLRERVGALQSQASYLAKKRDSAIFQISASIDSLGRDYKEAQEYYQNVAAWYKFKVFLLIIVFVFPFFTLSLYLYLKLKRKGSPYTIIFTAIAAAFSILFIQAVGVFLYDILPKEWFSRIFKFFLAAPFLRYVIYYGSVIVVIGIFGGIVYYIQKKVFDPAVVAIRRLKDHKCPGCSFILDLYRDDFCPKCGFQIKEKCGNCDGQKIRYLAHCPHCGRK